MKITQLASGVGLLVLYLLAFIFGESILGLPLLLLGVFLVLSGARAKNLTGIERKAGLTIYEGLISIGMEKIKKGEITVDETTFKESMEKLKPFILRQESMPQIGFNSIYLNYRNEASADSEMKNISTTGLKCTFVHDKSNFSIKVDFQNM
ncbi:MAG: hypothetical protein M1375_01310 [Candidatus Thermoplasmatota archaeon]|jgi:hypothetical protein|nr:hypothetical protein [Candidatus Thermoplasmatota archaeon]MCL5790598.1 hypothetical protein [Candidatus Thermoplasmatota archaeon]